MRRKVKDAAELKRLALQRGMTVKDPKGRVFNAAKAKGKPPPKVKPKPAPEPVMPAMVHSKPIDPNPHDAALIRQMEQIGENISVNSTVMRDLAVQIASKADRKASPHSWTFEFERDENNYLTRIIANPRRLN